MFGLKKRNKITSAEVKTMIENKESFLLIDVRRPEEFMSGHIRLAKNIPNYSIDGRIINKIKNRDQKIVVYCHTGSRARGSARRLTKFGYTNVYNLGGLLKWPYDLTR